MIASSLNRRQFISGTLAAGLYSTLPSGCDSSVRQAVDKVNLGFISCGGRASGLMGVFSKIPGVNIAGLCDPDEGRLESAGKRYPAAKKWKDLRDLIEDSSIDAVVVATCNHWHCLAAIWAMEAGKDVYVEKPLSHSQWEGLQTVKAARKYGRICQVGTQQRSDPMQAEIKEFLHAEQGLGKILSVRVNRIGVRGPIGKRSTPLEVARNVEYDLWLGPAEDQPIFRNKLQYDWHWDWNTGSGEMGNWGVHVLDDVRNNVFRDSVALPKRIIGGGGRAVWNDAGETPNVHFVYFDTGSIPVVIGLSNLTGGPDSNRSPAHPGPGSGYIVYCEGGRFEGQRGRGTAYDVEGRAIKQFRGNSGNGLHQANFIDAVRAEDATRLNTEVKMGHDSTGWCNMANIAFQAGQRFARPAADQVTDGKNIWQELLNEMDRHVGSFGLKLESDDFRLSPMLELDPEREVFTGDHAELANGFLKRQYRKPFVVPEIGQA